MKNFLGFLLITGITILVLYSTIKADYYPYPIIIIHGRGDKAETWQQMRAFFRQYYPDNYPGLIKVVNDGTEKPIFTYSVSDNKQRAELWTKEIFGRKFGKLIGEIVDNNGNTRDLSNNILLETTQSLCWLEESKRNFFTQNIPPTLLINKPITVKMLINSNKEITGAVYKQDMQAITVNIAEMPAFKKYTLIAHSTGCPVSRRYITAPQNDTNYPYKNDIWKLVTLGGVNAGSNWALAYNSLNQMHDWIGPALVCVGAGMIVLNPVGAALTIFSGTMYMALQPSVKAFNLLYDVDADLKPDSEFVENDLSAIKPPDVQYRNVVGNGYPTPRENDFDEIFSALNTFPISLQINPILTATFFVGAFLDFFWWHVNWPNGDGVMQIQEQRGTRPGKFLSYNTKTNQYINEAPYISIIACHSRAAVWNWFIHQTEGYICENEPGNENKNYKALLRMITDSSSLAVENSNTLTAVKMEPDGAYINIQHPIIHIDGSCDDYLIQWMGDNDRIRLRYDKFSNIDEVIKLKSTEEGVFDYQRAGDVGRGWFSQKDKRKGV